MQIRKVNTMATMTIEEKQEILTKLFYEFQEAYETDNLALDKIDQAKRKVEKAKKELEKAEEEVEKAKGERKKTNREVQKAEEILNFLEDKWDISVSPRDSLIIFQKYHI